MAYIFVDPGVNWSGVVGWIFKSLWNWGRRAHVCGISFATYGITILFKQVIVWN